MFCEETTLNLKYFEMSSSHFHVTFGEFREEGNWIHCIFRDANK